MIEDKDIQLSEELRTGFARLLTGFFHRTPDRIAEIKKSFLDRYEKLIVEARDDPTKLYKPEALEIFTLNELEERVRGYAEEVAWGVSLMDIT